MTQAPPTPGGPPDPDLLVEVGRRWGRQDRPASSWSIDPHLETYEEDEDTGGGTGVVRFTRSGKASLEREERSGNLVATVRAERPPGGAGRVIADVRGFLLGKPLASSRLAHERLTKVKALAVLSSDALSSVAYATEQTQGVLFLAGVSALLISPFLGAAIVALLFIVGASYRQTIRAYPKGGGSYIVASDNLGPLAGLVAGASLMTDYILTVAVSVSAGIGAVTSALPSLAKFTVPLGLAVIGLIVLANLRGIREAGSIFTAPTYLFVAGMLLMIALGAVHVLTQGTAVADSIRKSNYTGPAIDALTWVVILRAFASGCTALTGVEAISDGVPAFKAPEWKNARTTLLAMVVILAVTFAGVTMLAHLFQLEPSYQAGTPGLNPHLVHGEYQSTLSKLAHVVFGNGPGYFYIQATTAVILALAANTSFSDFPRLLYFMARDKYAPSQFGSLGDRLAFSNGIITLGLLAAILYTIFQGSTDALIPLYTIGVFLSFTLSQGGMVVRWRRISKTGTPEERKGWQLRLAMNLTGAVATFVVLVIAAAAKFLAGAWVVVALIPVLVVTFMAIHRHYVASREMAQAETPLTPGEVHPIAVVPINDLTDVTLGTLALARRLADDVIAVYISDDPTRIAEMQAKWKRWGNHVQLQVIESPYRSVVRPLLNFLDAIEDQLKGNTLMVILPELVQTRWWHQLLHNQTAFRIKAALLFRPGTVVINVPYHFANDHTHKKRVEQLETHASESEVTVPGTGGSGGPR
ncbi:MAG: APC family permease [Candidatus Dormibacteraeota bacterium]|nr:APC family permease [Candidatus Dormibacteraeota bacterium]